MKAWVTYALCALFALTVQVFSASQSSTGGINAPEQREKPYVILVSLDGFRADYLDRFRLPNLARVMKRGEHAIDVLAHQAASAIERHPQPRVVGVDAVSEDVDRASLPIGGQLDAGQKADRQLSRDRGCLGEPVENVVVGE